jgi:two-component system cell cycle sensor histidine kinase/response regulator CckA
MGSAARTILLVEDESAIRLFIRVALERAGFEVLAAASGRQAEAILHFYPDNFDLAIIDIVMSDGNGLDFANYLEHERPGSTILYISGYTESIAVEAITRRAPNCILIKPFTHEQLIERVRMLCDVHHRTV